MSDAANIPPMRGRARSRRARVGIAVAIAALIVVLLSLRSIAGFYTDFLWFDSLGFASVWRRVLMAQIGLAVAAMLIVFGLLWVNLYIAERAAPTYRLAGPEEEFVRRYHETIGSRPGLVRAGVAGLFAIMLGAGVGTRWEEWVLFRNRQDFGIEDPQFGVDIGFYVFQLPFIRFALTWLFTALVVVLILTTASHYLNGSIRVNAATDRLTSAVKVHVSVLLALLAVVKAADYWFQRYSLNFSTRGVIDGAGAADVNAQLPALFLLLLISLAAAAFLVLNIWLRGWVVPVTIVGLWALVAVVVGSIFPALYQRVRVEPNESAREAVFIERNISATRAAYSLTVGTDAAAGVDRRDFNPQVSGTLDPRLLAANAETIENLRLLDPDIVAPTFEALVNPRSQHQFGDRLDVDRYVIDGDERVVVIAARELDLDGVNTGWENQHVRFTHGYGIAMAPADVLTERGNPDFVVGSLPVVIDEDRIDLTLDQPRIYIGENLGGYAIVQTARCETDFALAGLGDEITPVTDDPDDPDDAVEGAEIDDSACAPGEQRQVGDNQIYSYDGDDGVRAGGFFRRMAFALRFQDPNPVFSGLIDSDSRFIYNRDVRDRAEELAPFLSFDSDTYPIVVDGGIKYVIDAYTTTDAYPYAQRADTTGVPGGSGLRGNFNYVRNSVKVVVDAYDGDVTFYVVDPDDPIIKAYMQAFPDLFTLAFPDDGSEGMPAEIAQHVRYPEDLFKVQTNMWGRYQLDEAGEWLTQAGEWAVAADPGSDLRNTAGATVVQSTVTATPTAFTQAVTTSSSRRIEPQYVQLRLPGEADTDFVLLRPFVPLSGDDSTPRLSAFMAGRVDEQGRPSLISYRIRGFEVNGPAIANETMLSNPKVAEATTFFNQQGSRVRLGNMLLVPLTAPEDAPEDLADETLLYLRPLYLEAAEGQPAVQQILALYGDTVRMCPTVGRVLAALMMDEDDIGDSCRNVVPIDITRIDQLPDPEPDPTTDPTPDEPVDDPSVLLQQAQDAFDEADQALADGDLGRYQELVEQAQRLVVEALAALDADLPATPQPTVTPEPTATVEPDDGETPTAVPEPTPGPTSSPEVENTPAPTPTNTPVPTPTPTDA